MKKALIIMIALAVALCAVFCVLFFVWTPQNMKSWGDDALKDGRIDRAIVWFERAVDAEPENPEYTLALVDANVQARNFTQAERNLLRTISVAPSATLYAKLSSVYVMQDKLYDAQKISENIEDASIRAQFEAMRPGALLLTPEGGKEYSELISVTIESEHTVYYSLSDDFPSTATKPYSEPIALQAGTTRVQAIAVSSDGLVGPLSDTSYRLISVIQEVTFVSEEFEEMIRQMLYIPSVEPVMTDDLWQITTLEVPSEITDYTDLQYLENLQTLTIKNSVVEDYSFLSRLEHLETLDLSNSYIDTAALGYIGKLPALKNLNLSNCGCSDISALSTATSLTSLDLSQNSIQDVSALENLQLLETLNLESNAITLLSSLTKMASLKELNIAKNNLSSLDPLESSVGLTKLIADDNQLMDVSVLASMTQLRHFTAANNRIADVSYLSVCAQMEYLDLGSNRLSSIDIIAEMPNLWYLDISNNTITALPELTATKQLQEFYAANNQLTDISCLASQPQLAYVNVDYNPELVDITCLSACSMLIKVDAFGTKVADIQALLDMSVIVNYDPSAVIGNQDNP